MTTPVAFIIFNRPDTTEKVFAEIRRARPSKLYIIADGPRTPEEKALTDAVRDAAGPVDWPCEVNKIFSNNNLGCRGRVITGLNEVFEKEEKAIIVEDDCLPHPDFFEFCEVLLEKYQKDDRVGTINGTTIPGTGTNIEASYYFSNFSVIWGWATWKRTWQLVDNNMEVYSTLSNTEWLGKTFPDNPNAVEDINKFLNMTASGYNAWSYVLLFATLYHQKINIHPRQNLVSNIGFDSRGTHTIGKAPHANLPAFPLGTWNHPDELMVDQLSDLKIYKTFFEQNRRVPTFKEKLVHFIKRKILKR